MSQRAMNDYYRKHFLEYHNGTFLIDPSPFLSPLRDRLSPGVRVLDVGCGSGRDLLWMKSHGFDVKGFELSPGLAQLARRNAGCEIIVGDFTQFDFSALSFDAILLIGALVHLPHSDVPDVLHRISQALVSGGLMLLSLKEGRETQTDETGRTFYLWEDSACREVFEKLGLREIDFLRQTSRINDRDVWLGYVLEKKHRTP